MKRVKRIITAKMEINLFEIIPQRLIIQILWFKCSSIRLKSDSNISRHPSEAGSLEPNMYKIQREQPNKCIFIF